MNLKHSLRWLLLLTVMSLFIIPLRAQEETHTVVFDNVQFEFPASLASGLQIEVVEAVPLLQPGEQLVADIYPEHVRFRFLNYMDGSPFWLPYPIAGPQILVYSTDAIRNYSDVYIEQMDALNALLQERPDLTNFADFVTRQSDERLPFLPVINSAQVLRSHPQYIEIDGVSSGIRYVTHYSQEAAHITDDRIFYTFQGILADGAYYVSAILPVKTGVLPEEIDTSDIDWEEFGANYSDTYLPETFAQINGVTDDAFTPDLNTLDSLMQSIRISTDTQRQ